MRNREIARGDRIRVRDAYGEWHEATALSGCRVDLPNAINRKLPFVSVRVRTSNGSELNWPAVAVERITAAGSPAPDDP